MNVTEAFSPKMCLVWGVEDQGRVRRETHQGPSRVGPVEFNAYVELGVGSADELQLLPYSQPLLHRGQGEVMNLVSCGKGREGSRQTAYCSPETSDAIHFYTQHFQKKNIFLGLFTQQKIQLSSDLRFSLTHDSHNVQRRLESLISNPGLAGHHTSIADKMSGHNEAHLGIPHQVFAIRMKLFGRILLTDTGIYRF